MIVVVVVVVVGTSQYIQSANPLSTELPLDSRGRSMITRWRLDEYSSCTRVSAHRYIHQTCINTSPIIILRTCLAAHATIHTYIHKYAPAASWPRASSLWTSDPYGQDMMKRQHALVATTRFVQQFS